MSISAGTKVSGSLPSPSSAVPSTAAASATADAEVTWLLASLAAQWPCTRASCVVRDGEARGEARRVRSFAKRAPAVDCAQCSVPSARSNMYCTVYAVRGRLVDVSRQIEIELRCQLASLCNRRAQASLGCEVRGAVRYLRTPSWPTSTRTSTTRCARASSSESQRTLAFAFAFAPAHAPYSHNSFPIVPTPCLSWNCCC